MGLFLVTFSEPLTPWCKLLLLKKGPGSAVPPSDWFPEIFVSWSIQHPLCPELLGKAESPPSLDVPFQYILQVRERWALNWYFPLGCYLLPLGLQAVPGRRGDTTKNAARKRRRPRHHQELVLPLSEL